MVRREGPHREIDVHGRKCCTERKKNDARKRAGAESSSILTAPENAAPENAGRPRKMRPMLPAPENAGREFVDWGPVEPSLLGIRISSFMSGYYIYQYTGTRRRQNTS